MVVSEKRHHYKVCKITLDFRFDKRYNLLMTNNKYMQVGRNCLKDFLGYDVSALCAVAEVLMGASDLLSAAEDEDFAGGGGRHFYTIQEYLPFVACSIRKDGWLSRGEAYERGMSVGNSTADLAFSHGVDAGPMTQNPYKPEEKDYNLAAATIEFCEEHFANANVDDLTDYENSLRVAMASGIVHPKFQGIIASSIKYYQKDVERRAKNENWANMVKNSKFQGAIKERKVFENLKVLSYRTWDSTFGTTHFYSFIDENGNAFTYFASKDMNLAVGQIVSLKATIKKHEIYTPKFDKAPTYAQTVLTRCSLVTRATVASYEVVEKKETKGEYDAITGNTTYTDITVKYHTYRLVGEDGRKFVLVFKSKKKDLVAGVKAIVEYEPFWSNNPNAEHPVSLVVIL